MIDTTASKCKDVVTVTCRVGVLIMSNDTNTKLIELAEEHLEFWVGTVWENVIRNALIERDYEQLEEILIKSARAMAQDYEVEV